MNQISEFQNKYRFLSNFWPISVQFDGILFPSVEHAYQTAKTLDIKEREVTRLGRNKTFYNGMPC